ncbi:MAG: PH domain-containing protein [Planctomycetes bacterium]|nr:PH domain-containing protein [Planctomycetota bacterium]
MWAGRTDWRHYAGRIGLWVAGCVSGTIAVAWVASSADWLSAGPAFWVIVGGVFVSGSVILGRVALTVLSRKYRLTTQRLFIECGILSRTIDQTELIRVDDVRIHQTVIDRLFQLGTVYVLSSDTTNQQVELVGIRDVDAVAEAVRNQMRAMRKKSLFVETI